jgi:hypothetical protein
MHQHFQLLGSIVKAENTLVIKDFLLSGDRNKILVYVFDFTPGYLADCVHSHNEKDKLDQRL